MQNNQIVSNQNKELFQALYQRILDSHYVLIVTHKNPDADTISCALSLSTYFFENRIKHKVYNESEFDTLPRRLNFLNKFDKISNTLPKFYDLIIYVDCADEFRVTHQFDKNIFSAVIDHHQSNKHFTNLNIVDDTKGSTAELLYSFYETNNLSISKANASCLYTGIYDDSIAFTTPRTDQNTFYVLGKLMESNLDVASISTNLLQRDSLARFRLLPKIMNTLDLFSEGKLAIIHVEDNWMEQTGALVTECDDVVDSVLSIGIVQIVAYLRVIDGSMRVSLRSKGDIDVSTIAAHFNGGGHKNAAGLTLDTLDISKAKCDLVKTIQDYI